MEGTWLACGGVAGVANVRHVSALARCVLERTPHVLLVGDGAQQFAIQQGFSLEILHTPESIAQWNKLAAKRAKPPPGTLHESLPLWPNPGAGGPDDHDTVTVLARMHFGHLAGCCTTSGLAHRLPGRVGDSPIIGAGLYVDDEAGAAGATGVGEEIIRVHGAGYIVELMRSGQSAQAACEAGGRAPSAPSPAAADSRPLPSLSWPSTATANRGPAARLEPVSVRDRHAGPLRTRDARKRFS